MNDFDQVALLLLILVPLAGALLMMFMPAQDKKEAWYFAIFVSGISLVLSLVIFARYDYDLGGFQFIRTYEWLPGPLDINLSMGIDGISAPLVLLNGIMLFGGVLISQTIHHRPREFFVLLLALAAGVYGVFAVRDLFFLFFFYELAVLPMYLLIGVWGSSTDFGTFLRTKEYGAMKLILFLVAGSILVWIGILAVYVEASNNGVSTFSLQSLAVLSQTGQFDSDFQTLVFPLFMVGFGVLAGLWPFHTWSPDGHVAAPTAVSMLHAGVLMKLGAYGIIRVGMFLLPEGAENWMPVLIGLGAVNVIYGAVSAMSQQDLKYIIGYSSVSHMGYVLIGIATLDNIGMGGAVLQMFSHGIMTGLMFLLVGAIYHQAHTRDIGVLKGLAGRMPVNTFFFAIAGLASLGLPGLSGFVAEFMVFTGAFRTYLPMAVIAVIGAALTAVYILRLLARTFLGEPDSQWESLVDASPVEKSVGLSFVFILIFVGVWPEPLMRVINVGVQTIPGV
ncbi:MAG: NADH-quinone oxidoreductase subunit M [SAR202 cluster bacterium]|nr:NADH-quinone oxidoreductase subunit M [Chloroflexota bacterium]MQF94949.1 NADH-quinone oxidoreductase subunit M [SAR202 cluster bacterium]HAA96221.1 NADH-quinone oxidoreductase subunit M [Dehalococcoidia bacterium]MBO19368.1 NADH-quinone oxidoreductase subunit M [Chloroflexota bacterium]MQG33170.1 NADH-quinone oxidoreductase subunit M [SAR202 cluster bacterium]|tara:strand:+ start:1802 stop:3313 length:1512 start_codon:yes stop_codon:yes gene_type:complete